MHSHKCVNNDFPYGHPRVALRASNWRRHMQIDRTQVNNEEIIIDKQVEYLEETQLSQLNRGKTGRFEEDV